MTKEAMIAYLNANVPDGGEIFVVPNGVGSTLHDFDIKFKKASKPTKKEFVIWHRHYTLNASVADALDSNGYLRVFRCCCPYDADVKLNLERESQNFQA